MQLTITVIIFYINGILTATTTPGQCEPESNGNKEVIPCSTKYQKWDMTTGRGLVSYLGEAFLKGSTPLQRIQSV